MWEKNEIGFKEKQNIGWKNEIKEEKEKFSESEKTINRPI